MVDIVACKLKFQPSEDLNSSEARQTSGQLNKLLISNIKKIKIDNIKGGGRLLLFLKWSWKVSEKMSFVFRPEQ